MVGIRGGRTISPRYKRRTITTTAPFSRSRRPRGQRESGYRKEQAGDTYCHLSLSLSIDRSPTIYRWVHNLSDNGSTQMKAIRRAARDAAGEPLSERVDALLGEIGACRACESSLPLGPRPVVRISASARILMVGQAPGLEVHESGVPCRDASGKRLREWPGVDEAAFYDVGKFAIVPMGMCYPGRGGGGDLPPRPECAPLWHDRIFSLMPHIELTILIGQYAHAKFLGARRGPTLTDTVENWEKYAPVFFALPHPSPRNQIWLKRNPWFEQDVLPSLKDRVARALA